jgi:hypothetical protein
MKALASRSVGTLVARSAQCEVVVGTDWQLNGSLQTQLVKEKREHQERD